MTDPSTGSSAFHETVPKDSFSDMISTLNGIGVLMMFAWTVNGSVTATPSVVSSTYSSSLSVALYSHPENSYV